MTISARATLSMLTQLARPALHVVSCDSQSGFSKLGGTPNLPRALTWPRWNAVPLSFLGQMALTELAKPAPIPFLPSIGCLYFFYDADQSTWGDAAEDAGSWAVLYSASPPGGEVQLPPNDLDPDGVFEEKAVSFVPIVTLPDLQRVPIDLGVLEDGVLDAVEAATAAPFGGLPKHQVGGYPAPHQFDPMEETVAELVARGVEGEALRRPPGSPDARDVGPWHLLLQLDSDDDTWMRWDDGGTLYFWVHESDLARRDFSHVWMIKQSD